jgi:hypothetical protein
MNLNALDALRLEMIIRKAEPTQVFRNFMLQVGQDFRKLTAAYMEQLLQIYLRRTKARNMCFSCGNPIRSG